jgi:2,5-furandicarboxylate decarboxylase 1
MQENFRQFLDRLRQTGDLVDLHQPVDIRHIATLVDQAKTALFFHNVIGYDMPVVSGIIRSRERAIMALGCETYREIEDKLQQAIDRPIPPQYLKTSPTRWCSWTATSISTSCRSRCPRSTTAAP